MRTRIALLDLRNDTTASTAFIVSSSTPTYLFQGSLYGTQTLMADAFLVSTIFVHGNSYFLIAVIRCIVCILCMQGTNYLFCVRVSYIWEAQVC